MSITEPSAARAPLQRLRGLLRPAFVIYAFVLAAFVGLGCYILYDSYQRQTEAALGSADNLSRVFAERLEGTLRRIDSDLTLFAEFLPADALDDASIPRYRKQFEDQFALVLKNFPEIASRNVINARGISIYRAGVQTASRDLSDRDWFVRLRDDPHLATIISDVITARASGKPTIVISHAIRDRNGRFRGTVNATLRLELLNSLVSSLSLGDHGIITVRRTDKNKIVLRHPPAPDQINTTSANRILQKINAGARSARFLNVSTIDDIERATAFRVLNNYPFYVAVGLAAADYLEEWRKTALYSALAAFALMLAMSAFVINRVRNETRLSGMARELRSGKAALLASEQFLRDVIESVSDGLLVEDMHGRVRAINRQFQRMWNIPVAMNNTPDRTWFEPHMAGQLVNAQTLPLRATLPNSKDAVRMRPIELISGRSIETTVSQLLHEGRVEGRVWSFHDVTESKRTFRQYRSIIESSADAFVAFDDRLRITGWSLRAEKIFGLREDRALGRTLAKTILPSADTESGAVRRALDALQCGNIYDGRPVYRVTARRDNGVEFPAEIQISGFRMGDRWQYTSFVRDISARLREEDQVAQAQKFEAIGQLTGGLAHDFNNLLGIIIGSLDLIGEDFKGDRELLDAAASAAQRGAEVTRSLLAVARGHKLSPRDVHLDAVLHELAPLLRHTAGKGIDIELCTGAEDALVNIDAGGLNNALINLVINARDAMPAGGRLTISSGFAEPADATADKTAQDTHVVAIKVADSGCGMTPEVASRAFDPFFTTKARSKGTGLGLAMVYGFARQSGGTATLSSTPNAGTVVELRLPLRSIAAPSARVHVLPAPAQTGGNERILLVDDEADLLRVTRQWLQSLGYAVTAETDARRAVQLLESTPFDALVSDVVMPGGVNGVALADIATQRWPQIAVVLVSGFADVQLGHHIEKYHLLDKPFEKSQLQQALRAAIAQSRNGEKTVPPQQAAA